MSGESESFSQASIDGAGGHETAQFAQEGRLSGRSATHAPSAKCRFDDGVCHAIGFGRTFDTVGDSARCKVTLTVIVGDF
jgi:hypothetical protein